MCVCVKKKGEDIKECGSSWKRKTSVEVSQTRQRREREHTENTQSVKGEERETGSVAAKRVTRSGWGVGKEKGKVRVIDEGSMNNMDGRTTRERERSGRPGRQTRSAKQTISRSHRTHRNERSFE